MGRQTFQVTLQVPIGERRGNLWWETQGESLHGILNIMGHENPFSGRLTAGHLVELEGNIVTLMRSISYRARGNLQDGRLSLQFSGPRHNWKLEGAEAAEH